MVDMWVVRYILYDNSAVGTSVPSHCESCFERVSMSRHLFQALSYCTELCYKRDTFCITVQKSC